MAHPTGESKNGVLRLDFDRRLMLQFRGSLLWLFLPVPGCNMPRRSGGSQPLALEMRTCASGYVYLKSC
jgi:hypothetical protein